jgi:aquaporin-4
MTEGQSTVVRGSANNKRPAKALKSCCHINMARLKEDLRRLRFWRSIISEFVGSLFLVMIGCGSYTVSYPENPVSVKVALAFGLAYITILYCVRNVGDAHLNPSVTVAMLATRRSSPIAAVFYITAQMFGALIGAALVYAVTAAEYRRVGSLTESNPNGSVLPIAHWWPGGCTVPSPHTNEAQAFAVELFATFIFVFVVFAAYDKTKADRITPASPFIVGLANAAVLLFSIPYSGGSTNTARSFGPALVNRVWKAHWVYWFGPLIGGICGGAFYDMIYSTKSSFSRIRTCMLVFHQPDDANKAESASPGTDPEKGDGGDQTELPGEPELVEVEYTDGSKGESDNKPRRGMV